MLHKLLIAGCILLISSMSCAFDEYHIAGLRDLKFGDSVEMVIQKTKKHCMLERHFEKGRSLQYICTNYQFLDKPFDFYAIFFEGKLYVVQLSLDPGRKYYKDVLAAKFTKKYGKPEGDSSRKLAVLKFTDGVSVLLGGHDHDERIFISYRSLAQRKRDEFCSNNPYDCPE